MVDRSAERPKNSLTDIQTRSRDGGTSNLIEAEKAHGRFDYFPGIAKEIDPKKILNDSSVDKNDNV